MKSFNYWRSHIWLGSAHFVFRRAATARSPGQKHLKVFVATYETCEISKSRFFLFNTHSDQNLKRQICKVSHQGTVNCVCPSVSNATFALEKNPPPPERWWYNPMHLLIIPAAAALQSDWRTFLFQLELLCSDLRLLHQLIIRVVAEKDYRGVKRWFSKSYKCNSVDPKAVYSENHADTGRLRLREILHDEAHCSCLWQSFNFNASR